MKNKIIGWLGMIIAAWGMLVCLTYGDRLAIVINLCIFGLFFYVSYLLKKEV